MNIGFIGIGNMGGAIFNGLHNNEKNIGNLFYIKGRDFEKTKKMATEDVIVCKSTNELVENSDIFFIGIKPNKFSEVLPLVAEAMDEEKICVSMAAGITISSIEADLGCNRKIIRIMPNTPCKVGELMASASRNKYITDDDMNKFLSLLRTMGKAEEVPEEMIHGVIGISGSSPAYTYMYIDALVKAGIDSGIEPSKARIFAAQAVLGAAKMVLEEDTDLETLVKNVCSPGGTTIEAVNYLKNEKFNDMVKDAAKAAIDKSILMSKK